MHVTARFEDVVRRWQDRISCASHECQDAQRTWKRLYDGAGSTHVHGMRFCFPDCFEGELSRRFESLLRVPLARSRSHHRIPLGLLMLSRGDLDNTQLHAALTAQRRSGTGRIGEWITKLGFAREEQITAALAAQWSCPVLRTVPARPADCDIPLELLKRYRMAPAYFAKSTGIAHIAFSESIEYRALLAVEEILKCKAEACIASPSIVSVLLTRLEEQRNRADHCFESVHQTEEMTRITSSYAGRLRTEDVRLAACGEFIWVRLDAGENSVNLLFPQQRKSFPYGTAQFQPQIAAPDRGEIAAVQS